MKRILFLLLGVVVCGGIAAAEVEGIVVDPDGAPLPGVYVYWHADEASETITRGDGTFAIAESGASRFLIFDYVGYRSDTLVVGHYTEPLRVQLAERLELDSLTVSARAMGYARSSLQTLPVEVISGAELTRAACCNLGESFTTNPSVDVAYSDAATGAKQIRLLGLSGKYVQMLAENIPTLRGLGQIYGLSYIPGTWMQGIMLSKGSSSVLQGYESITGQIDVEYLKPQKADRLTLNLFGNSDARIEGNLTSAMKVNEHLSTAVMAHYEDESMSHDENDDKFLDLPRTRQYHLYNRWYAERGNYRGQWGVRYLDDRRRGGQNHAMADVPFRVNAHGLRAEAFVKNGYIFSAERDRSIGVILSGVYHRHDADFGAHAYEGQQGSFYANVLFKTKVWHNVAITTGGSFAADHWHERLTDFDAVMERDEWVPGVFGELTWNWNDRFQLLGGLRADYHNRFGAFVTPRVHVRCEILPDQLTLRLSAGQGTRTANPVAENLYLLASARTWQGAPDLLARGRNVMERAWNYGATLSAQVPMRARILTLNAEYFYTRFSRQVVADLDADAHAVVFRRVGHEGVKSFAHSVQIDASVEPVDRLTLLAAFRLTDARQTTGGRLRRRPLASKYKTFLTLSYATPFSRWQFDVTGALNGGGRMPQPDPEKPMWKETFKAYPDLQAQITRNYRGWSFYVGGENLTGYMQAHPIISAQNAWGENFDATLIYGPMHGRKFYAGIRLRLE